MFQEKREKIKANILLHFASGNSSACILDLLVLISEQLDVLARLQKPAPTAPVKKEVPKPVPKYKVKPVVKKTASKTTFNKSPRIDI